MTSLKIVQYNVWQLKHYGIDFSKDRLKRLNALPDALADTQADIIALEEVWTNTDKKFISEEMKKRGYPFRAYTLRRWNQGDGLLLLSRHPIIHWEASDPFRPATVFLDRLCSKRVIHALIDLPRVGPIDMFIAHTGPVFYNTKKDIFPIKQQKRLKMQLLDIASFIREKKRTERVFLAGDLNQSYLSYDRGGRYLPQYSENYQALIKGDARLGELKNSFMEANHLTVQDPPIATYSLENRYAFGTPPSGETLDYILFQPTEQVRAVDSKLIFNRTLLSDHYGVESTFEIQTSKPLLNWPL